MRKGKTTMLAVITLVALSFWFSGCVFIIPEITVEPVNIFDPANDWYGSIVVESSTPDYSENNPLSFLTDGNHNTRWVSEGRFPTGLDYHWVKITLPEAMALNKIVLVSDDGAGNHPTRITREFALDYWNGAEWVQVVHVTENTDRVVEETFDPVKAKEWRLRIIQATQSSDRTIRLYELELWTPEVLGI